MRLRELRLHQSYSQRELALLAGVSEKTIKLIEAGSVQPHPSTVRKLAEALKVKPWELRGDSNEAGKMRAAA